jgi:hypothetical protein
MGWSLDVIRPFPGESLRDAVDRVYAGGFVMECAGDTTLVSRVPGRRDHTRPRAEERAEMLETLQRLAALDLGLEVVEERRARRRRWPYWYVLVSDPASLQIDLFVDCAELSGLPGRDRGRAELEWALWWRVLRDFGRRGYFTHDSSGGEIQTIPVSYCAPRAREYFGIF